MSYAFNYVQAGSYTSGRQGNPIKYIIVHWWGDPANHPTLDGTVAYFARGGNKTSAHYVAEAGRVTQMVKDSDTAYQAGTWAMNLQSIGIECNPRCTDADKATIAELIINLRKIHGNLPIIGHRDVVSTDCPGTYYPPNVTLAPWLNPATIPPPVITSTPTYMEDDMSYVTNTNDGGFELHTPFGKKAIGDMTTVLDLISAIDAKASRAYGPTGWVVIADKGCLPAQAALLETFEQQIRDNATAHAKTL